MTDPQVLDVAVIGGGPAGLMAAEALSGAGLSVAVFERMPTLGRKFLMAGRGGLNLTHSEDFERFVGRYGGAAPILRPMLEAFTPADLVAWADGLGQATFVGTSGRVFPKALKASPLLRAWIARLEGRGVALNLRSTWTGWNAAGDLTFDTPDGPRATRPRATILALGGASWARLGSDGAWAPLLAARGAAVTPFRPANVGFTVAWTEVFRERFAGAPLKNIALSFEGAGSRGDALAAGYGLEGGAVYALSAALRDAIQARGAARLEIDLRPDVSLAQLTARLSRPRGGQSLSSWLRKAAHLSPVEIGLLREAHGVALPVAPDTLAAAIKAAPIVLTGAQGLERAISCAGGLSFEALDGLELKAAPGVFVAGEMLDWEAPTGGYLLQACFATGVAAARAVIERLG
ncbi:NAD(FAD)-utilizing dehydrogenase [Caulobacter sp. Root487D2Y]|uniref:NAD(P)/FAD-dependent oxidoreductase n=1 Tax=Caulobacter sp. Root487D2Y TaxID=1736547 RepID=UPI0006F21EF3|nr:TIGR03862 family flavoprotein [Caulobacter sp. Root487D2Y]KQY29235.1 NAD(FAD)-utilizing dehydrogenase [Caulobacter sp. Root487D2Y]